MECHVLFHGEILDEGLIGRAVGDVPGQRIPRGRQASKGPDQLPFTGGIEATQDAQEAAFSAAVRPKQSQGSAGFKVALHASPDPRPAVSLAQIAGGQGEGGLEHSEGAADDALSEARMKSRMMPFASLTGNSISATLMAWDMLPPVTYKVR